MSNLTPEQQRRNREKIKEENNASVKRSHRLTTPDRRTPIQVSYKPSSDEPCEVVSLADRRRSKRGDQA